MMSQLEVKILRLEAAVNNFVVGKQAQFGPCCLGKEHIGDLCGSCRKKLNEHLSKRTN